MVPPYTLPPSPSTSTPVKTPDPQPPNLSALLTETGLQKRHRQGLMMALNQQLKEIS
jgi:hypothetical protein